MDLAVDPLLLSSALQASFAREAAREQASIGRDHEEELHSNDGDEDYDQDGDEMAATVSRLTNYDDLLGGHLVSTTNGHPSPAHLAQSHDGGDDHEGHDRRADGGAEHSDSISQHDLAHQGEEEYQLDSNRAYEAVVQAFTGGPSSSFDQDEQRIASTSRLNFDELEVDEERDEDDGDDEANASSNAGTSARTAPSRRSTRSSTGRRRGRPKGAKDSPAVDKAKRGRPKGARNKKGTIIERETKRRLELGLPAEPERRRRGRPKGSKNKKKSPKASDTAATGDEHADGTADSAAAGYDTQQEDLAYEGMHDANREELAGNEHFEDVADGSVRHDLPDHHQYLNLSIEEASELETANDHEIGGNLAGIERQSYEPNQFVNPSTHSEIDPHIAHQYSHRHYINESPDAGPHLGSRDEEDQVVQHVVMHQHQRPLQQRSRNHLSNQPHFQYHQTQPQHQAVFLQGLHHSSSRDHSPREPIGFSTVEHSISAFLSQS